MKNFVRIMVAAATVFIVLGLIITSLTAIIFGANIKKWFDGDSKVSFIEEKTIEMKASELKNIDIDLVNAELTVKTTDTDTASIKYTVYSNDQITETAAGGVLGLKEKTHFFSFIDDLRRLFRKFKRPVEITIPVSCVPDGKFNTVNGKVEINGINFDGLWIKNVNSKITLDNITVKEDIYAEGVNGSINLSRTVTNGEITLKTVNGSLNGDTVSAKSLDSKTVNGSIEFNGLTAKNIKGETVNGGIDLEVSGNEDDYGIRFNSVNGSLTVNGDKVGKDVTINRNKDNDINIKTVNGSGKIEFK